MIRQKCVTSSSSLSVSRKRSSTRRSKTRAPVLASGKTRLRPPITELIVAIARGAEFNSAVPETSSNVATHLTAKMESVRAAAAELIGRWKVKDAGSLLVKQAGAAKSSCSVGGALRHGRQWAALDLA